MAPDVPPALDRKGRIVIADDHELARLGLRTMLQPEPDLEVVGEAGTGREAVELSRQLEPDLVLMDIRMPDLDGLAATRTIKEELPKISILILTLSEDPDYLLEALRVGAAGYVFRAQTQGGPGARDLSRRNAATADPRWRISRTLRYSTFLRTSVRAPFARAATTLLNRYDAGSTLAAPSHRLEVHGPKARHQRHDGLVWCPAFRRIKPSGPLKLELQAVRGF